MPREIDCPKCGGSGEIKNYRDGEPMGVLPFIDCFNPDCNNGKITVYTQEEHFQALLKEKLIYQDNYVLKVGTVNTSQVVGKVYTQSDIDQAVAEMKERCARLIENAAVGCQPFTVEIIKNCSSTIRQMEDK